MATFLVVGVIGLWTVYCLIRLRSKKHRGCAACASYQAGSCPARHCVITAKIIPSRIHPSKNKSRL